MSAPQSTPGAGHQESITTLYKNHVEAIELHFKRIFNRVGDQLILLQGYFVLLKLMDSR